MLPPLPPHFSLTRNAMATRFEVFLFGGKPVALRAVAEEALDEIERLERILSPYLPESEIAHVNARAAYEPVRVSPLVFQLLQHAARLNLETSGAFDITIGPLMQCWGLMQGKGYFPSQKAIQSARECVGMHHVGFDPDKLTVCFDREGIRLDLGAIGKGYAVQKAAEIIQDSGFASALIHGGTSSIKALGNPPDQEGWNIALEVPSSLPGPLQTPASLPDADGMVPVATVSLCNQSLSMSGIWGKSFEANGKQYGHILDPRTGYPAESAVMAAIVLEDATETDALSTALLCLGPEGHSTIAHLRPNLSSLVIQARDNHVSQKHSGNIKLLASIPE